MTTAENKAILHHAYLEVSQRNPAPLLDALADDASWTIIGSTFLSGTFRGRGDLLGQSAGGRLVFAGEHTQSARLGYADGAMTSGIREGKRLGQPQSCNQAFSQVRKGALSLTFRQRGLAWVIGAGGGPPPTRCG